MSQSTITLPTPASAQRVIDLIRAVAGHSLDQGACAWLTIRGDDTLSAAVYIGDVTVSTSVYGTALSKGDSETWTNGGSMNNVDLMNKYVLGSASGQKVNIQWEYV